MRRRLRTLRSDTFASMMEGLCHEARLDCVCGSAAHCDLWARGGNAGGACRRTEAHREYGLSRERTPCTGGRNRESNQQCHHDCGALVSRRSARACAGGAITEIDERFRPECARQYFARNAPKWPEYDSDLPPTRVPANLVTF